MGQRVHTGRLQPMTQLHLVIGHLFKGVEMEAALLAPQRHHGRAMARMGRRRAPLQQNILDRLGGKIVVEQVGEDRRQGLAALLVRARAPSGLTGISPHNDEDRLEAGHPAVST